MTYDQLLDQEFEAQHPDFARRAAHMELEAKGYTKAEIERMELEALRAKLQRFRETD
jgi:hypothetical protein